MNKKNQKDIREIMNILVDVGICRRLACGCCYTTVYFKDDIAANSKKIDALIDYLGLEYKEETTQPARIEKKKNGKK
ncbi:hypothetical protein [Neomegalonema sp.]|uniref:hypothetical protein n=1 Tax=Neomegalonema sp. TaxID=2039713 RepID=UPI002610409A|nr:hypothetical protein [Neomegalonema sp.]MDD2869653.1 hypothetical protein [Neomegalonema sp.]